MKALALTIAATLLAHGTVIADYVPGNDLLDNCNGPTGSVSSERCLGYVAGAADTVLLWQANPAAAWARDYRERRVSAPVRMPRRLSVHTTLPRHSS